MSNTLAVANVIILAITAVFLYFNLRESIKIRRISLVKEAYDKYIKIQSYCDHIISNQNEIKIAKENIQYLRLSEKKDTVLLSAEEKKLSKATDKAITEVANCYEHIGLLIKQGLLPEKIFFRDNDFATMIVNIYEITSDLINNKYYWQYLVIIAKKYK